MKIDLTHVTFNIPVRIDSNDRIRNIKNSVEWLLHFYDTNIIILESDVSQKISANNNKPKGLEYIFISDDNFHRTRYLNIMAEMSKTHIVVNYDADVIFPCGQFKNAVDKVQDGLCSGIFPYDQKFLNLENNKIERAIKEKSLDFIDVNTQHKLGNRVSLGGCIIWNKEHFIQGGGENENFVSWGWEDDERYYRFSKLGYNILRESGHLYHQDHVRGKNSSDFNDFYSKNKNEFERISKMDKNQLLSEISTWKNFK